MSKYKNSLRNHSDGTGEFELNRLLSESRGETPMNVEAAYVAGEMPFGRLFVLPKIVSAIQILPSEDSGSKRLGLLTQLPEGAEIEIGGAGFNDATLQVRCGASSYYVFLDDLDLVRKRAGAAYA